MIKQFVPSAYCLKCKGCCRFKEENSVWLPCLLDEEIQGLIDKEGIPAVSLNADKRIHPVYNQVTENFLCPFLNSQDNGCKIYDSRPFECQLYPFLINMRHKKIILTVDLNCPYIKENINSDEFHRYSQYLSDFLNSPAQIEILKDNPQIIQAYEDVLDVIELEINEEFK